MGQLGDMSERELKQLKNNFTDKLGERIRAEREKKKISQKELAERAGFYRTYI